MRGDGGEGENGGEGKEREKDCWSMGIGECRRERVDDEVNGKEKRVSGEI